MKVWFLFYTFPKCIARTVYNISDHSELLIYINFKSREIQVKYVYSEILINQFAMSTFNVIFHARTHACDTCDYVYASRHVYSCRCCAYPYTKRKRKQCASQPNCALPPIRVLYVVKLVDYIIALPHRGTPGHARTSGVMHPPSLHTI